LGLFGLFGFGLGCLLPLRDGEGAREWRRRRVAGAVLLMASLARQLRLVRVRAELGLGLGLV